MSLSLKTMSPSLLVQKPFPLIATRLEEVVIPLVQPKMPTRRSSPFQGSIEFLNEVCRRNSIGEPFSPETIKVPKQPSPFLQSIKFIDELVAKTSSQEELLPVESSENHHQIDHTA